MSQPTSTTSKPGAIPQAPPRHADPQPGDPVVVVKQPNWFVRSYRAVGRFFRTGWRGTKKAGRKAGNALVWAYDYLISRLDMLWTSLVQGIFASARWLIGLPAATFRYFWDTNSEHIVREIVAERQITRSERKRIREMEHRQSRAASRREQGARARGTVPANA